MSILILIIRPCGDVMVRLEFYRPARPLFPIPCCFKKFLLDVLQALQILLLYISRGALCGSYALKGIIERFEKGPNLVAR